MDAIGGLANMNDKIIYREGEIPLGEIKKQHEQGKIHVCAICDAELIVAFSDDEVRECKYGKGVFCPTDLKHINVRVMGKRNKLAF